MYTLLSGLYKYLFQKDEYFVLILGLDNAGKTTYLEQTKTKFNKNYQGMNLSKITSTVGLNIGKIDFGKVRLNFWDLGGQEELQSLWDKYYAESHAVIYIVDSSDRERLEESKTAFDKMITNSTLCGVPLMLLANKQDLDGCISVSDMRNIFSPSPELIGHRDLHVSGVSALKGHHVHNSQFEIRNKCDSEISTGLQQRDGVNEGIHWLQECIKKNSIQRPPTQKDIT